MRGRQTSIPSKTPSSRDDTGKRYFKLVLLFSIGIIAVMIIASIVTFLLTIEGEEQTLVPDVRRMELANAMIDLQKKGLVGVVQLRISANPSDKGTVLTQEPNPGTLVKVGRSVELRVSKGPIIDEIENYVNMKLTELKLQIQSMSTIYGALLTIKEPVIEVYDDSPPGTILEQKPMAGTKITDLTELELVVSRGPQGRLVTVQDYSGLGYYEALSEYAKMNAPFMFMSRPAEGDEEPGVVVGQLPPPDTDVDEGTMIQLIISEPEEIEEGWIFGILQRQLPDYPVPIDLFIDIERPDGEILVIASMKHPGGLIAIPYLEPEKSQIIVSTSLRELFRYTVRAPEN